MKVRLPKAVIEASARADEILKGLETEVIDNTSSEPVDANLNVGSEPAPETPTPAPEPPTPVEPEKPESYWEHRFKTLQGMFDAEKRRNSQTLLELEKKAKEAELQLLEHKSKSIVPSQFDVRTYLTEGELSAYGEDLPKMMLRVAAKVAEEVSNNTVTQTVRRDIEMLKDKSTENEIAIAHERDRLFWNGLNHSVPTWQTINADSGFHNWLSEYDGLSGITRQQILSQAEESRNLDTVIAVFKSYEKFMAAQKPAPKVDHKIIPESVPSALSPNSGESPIFTRDQIKQHYNDLARGKYRGRELEWEKLEKRIMEAYKLGRVS